jgi:flagellar protein FlaG
MSVQLGNLSLVAGPAAATQSAGRAPVATTRFTLPEDAVKADVVGSTPPAEVSEQVASAAQRAADLFADNRELHFTKDQQSGRIIVQVRDLDGNVLRTIPPSHALAVMSGADL